MRTRNTEKIKKRERRVEESNRVSMIDVMNINKGISAGLWSRQFKTLFKVTDFLSMLVYMHVFICGCVRTLKSDGFQLCNCAHEFVCGRDIRRRKQPEFQMTVK